MTRPLCLFGSSVPDRAELEPARGVAYAASGAQEGRGGLNGTTDVPVGIGREPPHQILLGFRTTTVKPGEEWAVSTSSAVNEVPTSDDDRRASAISAPAWDGPAGPSSRDVPEGTQSSREAGRSDVSVCR